MESGADACAHLARSHPRREDRGPAKLKPRETARAQHDGVRAGFRPPDRARPDQTHPDRAGDRRRIKRWASATPALRRTPRSGRRAQNGASSFCFLITRFTPTLALDVVSSDFAGSGWS